MFTQVDSWSVGCHAGFLLPCIKPTDRLLDVKCGPGTATLGFTAFATEGIVTGIDEDERVLELARAAAREAGVPSQGPGSVVFERGTFTNLPFPDQTFDVVFAFQLFAYVSVHDLLRILGEMRRVLKSGGILATRDAADDHFYPRHLDLDRLWAGNFCRALRHNVPDAELAGPMMPTWARQIGFGVDGREFVVQGGTSVRSSAGSRQWWAANCEAQLRQGALRHSWLAAGITEHEINETTRALRRWAATDGAWYGECVPSRTAVGLGAGLVFQCLLSLSWTPPWHRLTSAIGVLHCDLLARK